MKNFESKKDDETTFDNSMRLFKIEKSDNTFFIDTNDSENSKKFKD